MVNKRLMANSGSTLPWFIVIFLSTAVYAQDVNFNATVDKDRVTLNDQIELTLTVTGSEDTGSPDISEIDGFDIVSRGSSSQFSFINEKMSASKSFTYILMPSKEGKLTIPPIEIEAGGKKLKSDPIEIEVLKNGQAPVQKPGQAPTVRPGQAPAMPQIPPVNKEGLKDRVFIEVIADKNTAYVGEQITMTFRLYHRGVMIDNLQYTPPVTKGFVTENMGPQSEYQDVKNGIAYNVVELKTAIFPAGEGELIIEPARLKCDLLVREQKQRHMRGDFFDDFFEDPFFSNYIRYPVDLQSEPIIITITPFPSGNKPDSFKGAIGTYDLTVDASPLSLPAGEPVNLVMKVSGAGNITQVPEPIIKDLTGFKGYDSEIKTDITGRDPQIAGSRIFRKVIIPQDENVKEISTIGFSYFDPTLKEYRTITKDPIPITVTPAPKKDTGIVELIKELTPEEETKKRVELLGKDIQFIKTSSGKFTQIGSYWYNNVLLWIVIIFLPLLISVFSFAHKAHKMKLEVDTAYAKARGAHRIAKQFLNEAIKYQKQDNPKEFYDAIARAIQKFISDRLNVPIGQVTVDLLIPKGIKIDSIKKLLETCDVVRFGAHSANQHEMKQVIKEAEQIIGILNKKL